MKLQLILPENEPKQGVINLKNFIDKQSIEGLETTEIDRRPHNDNQMGAGDILNSITAVITAATDPLVGLVKCLQKYVDNYRTKIIIPTKNGNIELSHGRSMKAEELKVLVTSIQEIANKGNESN